MRYCTNCGAEIKDGSKFCTSCGKEVNSEMTLEKAVGRFFVHYADCSGRAGRREFIYIFGSRYIVLVICSMLMMLFNNVIFVKNAIFLAALGFVLLTAIPYIMLCIRRLHDMGKSAMWYAIYALPCVGTVFFLFLLLKEGDKTANAYGPVTK